MAGCIKEDGNDGAHIGNLTKTDADDLLDFMVAIFERLITEPEKLKLAQQRWDARRAKYWIRTSIGTVRIDLEPTKLPVGSPRIKTNLIVVSFHSQRRHWQLWVVGQPALTLTFHWIMSNPREAEITEMLREHEHTPATFNRAWEIVQEVEAGE